jgi:hypothetical protein
MLPEISNLLSWWQWAILAAVPPAIVLLYFLKLKRRPLEVPSTFLWHKSIEDLHVNSIWQRLRNNWLLYLQLAFILLLLLALLHPSWQSLRLSRSRFVLIVDNSASMQAIDVAPNRLEEAKRRARELIDQMRSGDSAILISFSDTARVEQNFTDDPRQLRDALAAIRPSQHSTNLAEALKLAAGLVNPGRVNAAAEKPGEDATDIKAAGTQLFIFSDGCFPPVEKFDLGNLEPTFVAIGRPDAANVGIVAFGVGRSEDKNGKLQAFARLKNAGPAATDVQLELFLNDQTRPSDADHLSIPPGETRGLAFDLADFESGVLHVKAETGDQLPVDDEAWTVVGPPRQSKVLLITPKNDRLEQALTTKAAREVAKVQVESPAYLASKSYLDEVDMGSWDLVIYDRAPPAKMPRANTFFIGCLPPGSVWKAGPEVTLPQITVTATSHRLMQWVDVNEIQKVVTATPLVVPGGGAVLIELDAGPLLAIAPREGFEDLVLGMALLEQRAGDDGAPAVFRNTDWPWRASFASFIFNLLTDRAGGQDLTTAGSYRPGMPVTIEAADSHAGLDVQLPSGAVVHLPASSSGKLTFTATEELGVYRILSGGKPVRQFAVNLLDLAETNIRPADNPSIKIGAVDVPGKTGSYTGHFGIWRELVLAGLAVVLLEWFVYLRRVYV